MPRPTNLLDLVRSAGERPFGTLTPEEQRVKDYTTVDPRIRLKDLSELAGQSVPGFGDILSGVMAARDIERGDYGQAALNALGVLPMVGSIKSFHRSPWHHYSKYSPQEFDINYHSRIEDRHPMGALGLYLSKSLNTNYSDPEFSGAKYLYKFSANPKKTLVIKSGKDNYPVEPGIISEKDAMYKLTDKIGGEFGITAREFEEADLDDKMVMIEHYKKKLIERGYDSILLKDSWDTPIWDVNYKTSTDPDDQLIVLNRGILTNIDDQPTLRLKNEALGGESVLKQKQEPGFASGGLVGPQVVALKNPEGPKIRPIPIQYGPSIRPVNLMDLARSVGEQPFGELTPEQQRVKDYTTVDPRVRLRNLAELAAQSVPGIGDVLSGVMAARDVERGDYGQAALNAIGMLPMVGGLGAIKAYHGSPHRFEKFDMSKIGTGEGAQAYGHGLYFAESPEVADSYSGIGPMLHNIGDVTYEGKKATELKWLKDNTPEELALRAVSVERSVPKAKRVLDRLAASGDPDYIAAKKFFDANESKIGWESIRPDMKDVQPNIYETSLEWPDAAREAADPMGPQHFLDWDKPLSEQPENIIETLKKSRNKHIRDMLEYLEKPYAEYIGDKKTMESGLRLLGLNLEGKTNMNSQKAAALLSKQGIPGIRYLDQGSRGTGEGTYNYVVFDENIPKITAINDQPVARLQNEIDQFLQGSQQGGAERRRAK